MMEEEQGDTPEAIERWIAILEAIPDPTMSDDESALHHGRKKHSTRRVVH
ncbi:MAG TPA: hypothetical protein VFG68_03205 [Fimbriiglobus sp.]|nr:hypothetical protein [Fimbriiglobus sp.]